jgi:hypothetical protein
MFSYIIKSMSMFKHDMYSNFQPMDIDLLRNIDYSNISKAF